MRRCLHYLKTRPRPRQYKRCAELSPLGSNTWRMNLISWNPRGISSWVLRRYARSDDGTPTWGPKSNKFANCRIWDVYQIHLRFHCKKLTKVRRTILHTEKEDDLAPTPQLVACSNSARKTKMQGFLQPWTCINTPPMALPNLWIGGVHKDPARMIYHLILDNFEGWNIVLCHL